MGGKLCIRGLRVTIGMIIWIAGIRLFLRDNPQKYPQLNEEDIQEALWHTEELDAPFITA